MLAYYSLICMPLDAGSPSDSEGFDATLVTRLVIDPTAQLSPDILQRILALHPILSLPENPTLQGHVMDFKAWNDSGQKFNAAQAIPLALHYSGNEPIGAIRAKLSKLFTGTADLKALFSPSDLYFQGLEAGHFVDVNKIADRIRTIRTQINAALYGYYTAEAPATFARWKTNGTLESSADFQQMMSMSFTRLRWIDNCAQALLVKLLSDPPAADTNEAIFAKSMSDSLSEAREGIAKVVRRARPQPALPGPLALPPLVSDPSDVNLAISAILKNEFLARTFGFTSRWHVKPSTALARNTSLIIDLSQAGFKGDTDILVDLPLPTVFAQTSHTHPVSYLKVTAPAQSMGAFALLTAANEARYTAATLSAEHTIFNDIVLQSQNVPDSKDDAASHSLSAVQRYGLTGSETYGVSISAPPEDLVTHIDLRSDENGGRSKWPCYFMDDLWVGYRLDLSNSKHNTMTSTHNLRQSVAFASVAVEGESEDFIDREQPGDPSQGYSSTELMVYKGLSSGQLRDYLFLTEGKEALNADDAGTSLYRLTQTGYGKTEPLYFGETYDYRLRTVLAGGVSVSSKAVTPAADMKQTFPFFRARALKAGVIVSGRSAPAGDENNEYIGLSPEQPRTYVTIMPEPIDIDSARFHGLLFKNSNERFRHEGRRFIKDVAKAYSGDPETVDYFCDPDVFGFTLTVTVLNSSEAKPESFEVVDGVYCELRPHLQLEPVDVDYGPEGKWEKFKPIRLSFHSIAEGNAKVSVREPWFDLTEVMVFVPPAVTVSLSLTPRFNPRLLDMHASRLSSSAQMLSPLFLDQTGRITPAVTNITMEVVHSIAGVRSPPVAIADHFVGRPGSGDGPDIAIAMREPEETIVRLPARIDLDAASTGQVKLEATWNELAPSLSRAGYAFRPATAATALHSLTFKRQIAPTPSATAMFSMLNEAAFAAGAMKSHEMQLIEDKVFIGRSPDDGPYSIKPLDLKSKNRLLLKVEAVAVSRYKPARSAPEESRSNALFFDVPNSGSLPALRLSHAVPLLRPRLARTSSTHTQSTTDFAIRVYFHGPFGASGIGERLAIGVLNDPRGLPTPMRDVPKNVSQWGEDPIAIAHLDITKRLPRASDFVALAGQSDAPLEAAFYPENLVGGSAPVLYRDNVETGNVDRGLAELVSLASFAARFSEEQGLWYVDVSVANFFGWCGLAVYRHQPHSVRGKEISAAPSWIHVSVLYGEPIAVAHSGSQMTITVGPVFDGTLGFQLSALEFDAGVSLNLNGQKHAVVAMESYRVGSAQYFQATVAGGTDWTLETLRLGHTISRRPILPTNIQAA